MNYLTLNEPVTNVTTLTSSVLKSLSVLFSGYGEVSSEPHDISQTNTVKVDMIEKYNCLKCAPVIEIFTSGGQKIRMSIH